MALDTNPDGSTRRIYAQLSNFNGFGVLDFDTRKEIDRIEYPAVPHDQQTPGHGGNTAHGIGVGIHYLSAYRSTLFISSDSVGGPKTGRWRCASGDRLSVCP